MYAVTIGITTWRLYERTSTCSYNTLAGSLQANHVVWCRPHSLICDVFTVTSHTRKTGSGQGMRLLNCHYIIKSDVMSHLKASVWYAQKMAVSDKISTNMS